MPTTTNKQRTLTQLFTILKKHYEPAEPEIRPVLEQFIYAILREGAPRELVDRAFQNLQTQFFDWNEIRVSSVREIEEALVDLSDAEVKANRVVTFLQEVFETTYSFDLESIQKKGVKQAAKHLSRFQAATDFAVAWVTQHSLGGHAIPLDPPMIRVLNRLGLLEEGQNDLEVMRSSLEHLVPKSKGALFGELVNALAHDACGLDDPSCPVYELVAETSNDSEEEGAPAMSERSSRPKPR